MPVIAKFHQLFPLRGPIPLYRDLGHALVQSAIRTHEGSREAPGRSERRRGPGLLPTRGHWVCDMKVETTSPKAVITRGPSKMAPNATPTASEQVPANDGRCNAVNTKSKPVAAASCRLVSAPCSIFRATVRKLCPKKGALTTVQTTACCHGKNPSRICNLLPLLTGMTHPAPIESKLQSKTSRHPPNPKLLSEHPQPLSAPPELHGTAGASVAGIGIATIYRHLPQRIVAGEVASPPARKGPTNHIITRSSVTTAVESSICRVAWPPC